METRAFKFNIKQIDADEGTFEGYASTFGNTDTYGDIIEPGAFRHTLRMWGESGKPIPVLWQHNPSEPIGITELAEEDDRGLRVRGRLLLGINRAREALEALRANVLGGLSIGFSIPDGKTTRDKETGNRRIHEARLWEYSLVTWPANEEALVTGVKAAHVETLTREITQLREILANPINLTTNTVRSWTTHDTLMAQPDPHQQSGAAHPDMTSVLQQAATLRQHLKATQTKKGVPS